MAQKQEKETTEITNEPLRRCFDCIHWHMLDDGEKSGMKNFSSGSCDHNGYSKVTPMFRCPGWESGNGAMLDFTNQNT